MRDKHWESPYSVDPNWKNQRPFFNFGGLEDFPRGFPTDQRVVLAIHQEGVELLQFLKQYRLRPINYVTNWRGTVIQFRTVADAVKFRLIWPETEIVNE